jgi:hypothetical protein
MRARWAGVGFAAATTLLVVAGPAAADAPEGNARFTVAGAAVFDTPANGIACAVTADRCEPRGFDSPPPIFHNGRAGTPVGVVCRLGGEAKLLGFFDVGDDLVTGFTNVANVGGVDGRPANFRPCGVLDALTS